MRLKCPGSGVRMSESRLMNAAFDGTTRECRECGAFVELTKHGRLWTHSRYPKEIERRQRRNEK
jgi:hypothetical protein